MYADSLFRDFLYTCRSPVQRFIASANKILLTCMTNYIHFTGTLHLCELLLSCPKNWKPRLCLAGLYNGFFARITNTMQEEVSISWILYEKACGLLTRILQCKGQETGISLLVLHFSAGNRRQHLRNRNKWNLFHTVHLLSCSSMTTLIFINIKIKNK